MAADDHVVAAALTNEASKARIMRVLLIICGISFLATAFFAVSYWRARNQALSVARDRAHGEAVRAAKVIDADLNHLPVIVRGIAADLSSGRTPQGDLLDRLKSAVDLTPQLFGVGAAYTAYQHDPAIRLFAPYFRRTASDTELIDLDSFYDYTQGNFDWYQQPLKDGPSWAEPALTPAHAVPVVEFSAPFTAGPGKTQNIGVVHGAMVLSDVDQLIRSLDLGDFGYGFLVSKNGFVISHPFGDELAAENKINGKADEKIRLPDVGAERRAAARRMFDLVRTGKASMIENAIDPVTGQSSWVFSEPVPSTGWTVGVVFFKEETTSRSVFRRPQMRLTLAALVMAVMLVAMAFVKLFDGNLTTAWFGVVAITVTLIFGIGQLWLQAYASPSLRSADSTIFANTSSVRQFVLDTTKTSLKKKGVLPYYVPTGVYIQTMDVTGPNNIAMTGYVWQRYPKNIPSTVARAFSLPDASDSTIKEFYKRSDADSDTIGWTIKATIRQSFDYSKYPLDQQNFQLRLWHADLDKGVILMPDMDAYRIIHPLARLGIEKDLILPGWNVERTQFSDATVNRNTSFGVGSSNSDAINELSFNVVINRKILEPVFSSLLPLTVAAFMAFCLLLIVKESTRGNVVQIMSAFSGLFFVGIVSELDLRRRLSSSSVSYIEYYYFVMYIAILSIALLNMSNAYPGQFPRLQAREYIKPKMLFWPSIFTALLILTVVIFY